MTLAERLKQRREELGWSKAELRRRAGLRSASTLTSLENGETVDSPQLGIIASSLGVEVMWLQFGKGGMLRGSATPETTISERALHVARLVDRLPEHLSEKILSYARVVETIHQMDVEVARSIQLAQRRLMGEETEDEHSGSH